MKDTKMQDPRGYSRIQTHLLCEVNCGEVSFIATLRTISIRGASISSRTMLPKNSSISISVNLPELGKTLTLLGQVVRVSRSLTDQRKEMHRCGVHFNRVTPESMLLVGTLMAREKAGFSLRNKAG